jgi:hypothetical protein
MLAENAATPKRDKAAVTVSASLVPMTLCEW